LVISGAEHRCQRLWRLLTCFWQAYETTTCLRYRRLLIRIDGRAGGRSVVAWRGGEEISKMVSAASARIGGAWRRRRRGVGRQAAKIWRSDARAHGVGAAASNLAKLLAKTASAARRDMTARLASRWRSRGGMKYIAVSQACAAIMAAAARSYGAISHGGSVYRHRVKQRNQASADGEKAGGIRR